MSEAKFIKGPWKPVMTNSSDSPLITIETETGYTVADVDRDYHAHNEDAESVAHLIAAAPEMYEMLTKFLPAVIYTDDGDEVHTDGEFQWNEHDDPMILELQQLLAKARGEQ